MKFTHYFETTSAFTEAYNGSKYKKPWVSYTKNNHKVNYSKRHSEYLKEYFTIEALESGTIQWNISGNTVEYSKNDGQWTSWDGSTTLSVSSGDVFRFRGDNNNYAGNGTIPTIKSTFNYNAYGNIMSLISSTGFENLTTIPVNDCFKYFFGGTYGSKVVDASDLILPATTLTNYCYQSMFYNCTSLISTPELPATTLASYCYQFMFYGCTSLTTAPELPATTLADNCYYEMFCSCTSLTTAPAALPATTLTNSCYRSMFLNCSSLTTVPALPATTLTTSCYNRMFSNCTSLTTAPELPATTLANYCYQSMFYHCTSLNYIKCLATNISGTNCTSGWVNGVAATGTFVKNPSMGSWTTGNNGIPSGWTPQDA